MEYDVDKIEKNRKRRNKIKKAILICIYILLIPIIFCDIISIVQLIIMPNEHPNIFGYKIYSIISNSMSPSINKNDAIIVKVIPKDDINVNDIVTYTLKGETITHRVVEIDAKGLYTTMGDANNGTIDKGKITYEMIQGKYCFKIPKIGKILIILQKKSAVALIITILITLYLYERRLTKKKIERKKVREHYEKWKQV